MHPVILFDDGYQGLAPLTDLRASFELRTGALTTGERLQRQLGREFAAICVPTPLEPLIRFRYGEKINRLPDDGQAFVFLNGRLCGLSFDIPTQPGTGLTDQEGALIAACLSRAEAEVLMQNPGQCPGVSYEKGDARMLRRPWDLIKSVGESLKQDVELLKGSCPTYDPPQGKAISVIGDHPVLIGRDVVIHPNVVIDTTAGPVVLDDRAVVRSMSIMVGPAYVGKDSIICNHAHIRASTTIGPSCKVGGEVNTCIFQGYANKSHSGFLGHSYVGEWVNLGADTVTSNLKNTYGDVRMRHTDGGPAESTGMQFLGTIFADHVKTAVGTRLMSGSCLGTGSMVAAAAFAPKYLPRFSFQTDGPPLKYELDKFLDVARRVMARRGLSPGPELEARITDLWRRSEG